MSGVQRFLSRREKKQQKDHTKTQHTPAQANSQPPARPDHFAGIFTPVDSSRKKLDAQDEKKVKPILARLHSHGIENIVETNVEYALRATGGNADEAFGLLMLLEDTYEGIVRPYSPDAKLIGAVNREAVTCFLDALLFAMFARLDSFEAMLYEGFEDVPRRKLAGMLRLWVNMLRTGRLITTDITQRLQEALAGCGWKEALELVQQDPSEAFGFITGQLELPLLTLKMDLFHTGKEDLADDHKFVNERLLEVAIPDTPADGSSVMTLEHCLEQYFNNRIEVKRHLEAVRRNTLQGGKNDDAQAFTEKQHEAGLHIEVAELESPVTPLVATPIAETPTQSKKPMDKLRPGIGRKRADSIFSQRKVELIGVEPTRVTTEDPNSTRDAKGRKLSTRTEVLMPAWQFFKLLPWYTDHLPTSDAQVAAHFSHKRPVLGICLKRYSFTANGQATRRETYVDIPLEITVPNFVGDDSMVDHDGQVGGNFRLLLQSVVCHRGTSVHSGHYICLSRGQAPNANCQQSRPGSDSSADEQPDPWMRFDDLARERVSYVDIHEALKQETPYLLFYQVQPIDDEGQEIHDLPSYAEATSSTHSGAAPPEKLRALSNAQSDTALVHSSSDPTTDATEFARPPAPVRTSLDSRLPLASPERVRNSMSYARRSSLAIDDGSFAGNVSGRSTRTDSTTTASIPVTPSEEKSNAFLNVAKNFTTSRRGSGKLDSPKFAKSRPNSTGPPGDSNVNRFSLNMTKLTARMSRSDVSVSEIAPANVSAAAESAIETTDVETQRTSSSNADEGIVPASLKPSPALGPMQAPTGTASGKGKKGKEKKYGHHHKDGEERDCTVM